jgi:hypothetical protein
MKTLDHALMEFRAAGWVDSEGKFKDEMQGIVCNGVMKLLMVFAEEGHSGTSAPYAINMFKQLAMFKPIVPLTGEDWEWSDARHNGDGSIHYQNKRCSHVFKEGDGQAYDIDGRVFWEWYKDQETGEAFKSYYTSRDSRVYVTFPYTPKTEYVYKYSDSDPRGPKQNEEGLIDG